METQTVDLAERPRWQRLVEWVGSQYLERQVAIQEGGETVAVLVDPHAARFAAAIAERFLERRPPFEQSALDSWVAQVLEGVDIGRFMSGEPQQEGSSNEC